MDQTIPSSTSAYSPPKCGGEDPIHANGGNGYRHRSRYRPRGRQFRHGQRAAVLRAVTAARAYLRGGFSSLAGAANAHGSCPSYVAAAVVVLQSEDVDLVTRVLSGRGSLLDAAKTVKHLAALVTAWRAASVRERRWFGPTVGEGRLWDEAIAPNL